MSVAAAGIVPPRDLDFDTLYREHHPRVLNLCRHLLQSADEAEDAAADVFVRARRRADQFDRTRPFSSWVLGIAGHCCVDRLRRRRTEVGLFGAEEVERVAAASTRSSPLTALLAAERRDHLRRAVATLATKYRVPLVLAYYGELEHAAVARLLGISRSHVGVLIYRARQRLRQALGSGPAGPNPRES